MDHQNSSGICSQVGMFQSILNAANFKDALQDTLVSELASKNVSSHEFLSFIKLKHRLGSLFFEKSSFLCNLFLISNKLSLAKLYLTSDGRFVDSEENIQVMAIVRSTTIEELEGRVSKVPVDMVTNQNYANDMRALVFYTLMASDRDVDLSYEVENDKHFLTMHRRYKDKLRKLVSRTTVKVVSGLQLQEKRTRLAILGRKSWEDDNSVASSESEEEEESDSDEDFSVDLSEDETDSDDSDLSVSTMDSQQTAESDDERSVELIADESDPLDCEAIEGGGGMVVSEGDSEDESEDEGNDSQNTIGEADDTQHTVGDEDNETSRAEGDGESGGKDDGADDANENENEREGDDLHSNEVLRTSPSTRTVPPPRDVRVVQTISRPVKAAVKAVVTKTHPKTNLVPSVSSSDNRNSSSRGSTGKDVAKSTRSATALSETPAKKKKTKKRKRDNDYDVDKSSKSIISVDVGLTDSDGRRNTFFNLKKDFTNKDSLAHCLRHYQIGEKNGRLCFSNHQIHDLVLANKDIFNWPAHVESFTHVFMLVGLSHIYNKLKLVLMMRCAKFKDVVSIAVLVKMTKETTLMRHSSMLNSENEQSVADQIRWVFLALLDDLNKSEFQWVLKEIRIVQSDSEGYTRPVAVLVRIPRHRQAFAHGPGALSGLTHASLAPPAWAPSSPSSSSSSSSSAPSSSSSNCSDIAFTPRRASKKQCLRNPPLTQCWSPYNHVVSAPEELEFRGLDRESLQKLNKFCDTRLSFATGNGFKDGSHPLKFSSCLEIMELMAVGENSVVLEYGCGLPRLAILLASVSKYTVVCIDLPPVVNNINRILSVPRPGVVDHTDNIFIENAMRSLLEVNEEHAIVVYGAMDNTDDLVSSDDHVLNPCYLDRYRCSELALKYPVATVWTMNKHQLPAVYKNKNHLQYRDRDDDANVCSKLSDTSLILCDYLHCDSSNSNSTIHSFMDLMRHLVVTGKKTGDVISSRTIAVFPNRTCDAKRHLELKKYFSLRFVAKEAVDWYQIGQQYEDEMQRDGNGSSRLITSHGSNADILRAMDAVRGQEFIVLQRRPDGLVETACSKSSGTKSKSRK